MSKRVGKRRYPPGLKQQALDLLQVTGNVTAIAAQLGVHRTTVHYWLRQAQLRGQPGLDRGAQASDSRDRRIAELERQIASLEAMLGRKEVETRFFEGALRRIEELRRKSGGSGETPSTPKSGS